jgi:methyl-accepting chemotaxis protein
MNKLIRRLSLRGKFLLIAGAMLIPIGTLLYIAISLELAKIGVARHEEAGLRWASPLIQTAANLSEFREHAIAVAGGEEAEREQMLEHATAVRDGASKLDALMAEGDEEFIKASAWPELRGRVLAAIDGEGTSAMQLRAGPALIADVHARILAVGEQSELILDPGADTYPLMSSALFDLPKGIEALASARRAFDFIDDGDTSVGTHMDLASKMADARIRLGTAMHWLADNYARNATIESAIPAAAQKLASRLETAFKAAEAVRRNELGAGQAGQISTDVEALTEELSALREQVDAELTSLLSARARHSQWVLAAEIFIALAFVVLAFWIQIRVTGYISHKLGTANDVFTRLRHGEFDNRIGEQPGDELGVLLTGLGKMQTALAARVEEDRRQSAADRERALAGERIRQALDASSVNVIVADEQGDVIYVNPAAARLMAALEPDFRRVRPDFDAAKLSGMNLERFYADGVRQREHLHSLRASTTAELTVGSRSLRTIINPIIDGEARRIGTVIEWQDRTQELAAEKEVNELVVAVANGRLDERVSLDGKTGFYEVLAHGLNGVVTTVRDVVAELDRLVQGANGGDLTQRMDLEQKTGLYVSIGSGVNALVANMATMVAEVKIMAAQVQQGAEEISRGNANLSQRTEEQASSLEETASSMEQMTSTVKQTADNAGQANQLAMAARQQAEKGGNVVGAAVKAMSGINEASKKIADIIGVIDEIAFQTNLLALNAAVEAARAGEQGRGFAVVATEVRSLAGRSATAAKEIKALIHDSVARVDEGSKLVDESGRTLEEIVNAVKKVTDIVAEIAAASREQSGGIEQVNKAIVQMDTTTQQNAALVEQAAAASQAIVEQTHSLSRLVANYHVGSEAEPSAASCSNADWTEAA